MAREKERTYFEKLGPADQLAIESMVTKANKEELEAVYKETKSREAIRRKFGFGDFMAIVVILFFIAVLLLVLGQIQVYQSALQSAGLSVCQNHNSTYRAVDFTPYSHHVTIICTDYVKINLP